MPVIFGISPQPPFFSLAALRNLKAMVCTLMAALDIHTILPLVVSAVVVVVVIACCKSQGFCCSICRAPIEMKHLMSGRYWEKSTRMHHEGSHCRMCSSSRYTSADALFTGAEID
jgi:hypothetical protein